MRKSIGFILAFVALTAMFSACKDSETYADKLKNEKKAIDRFVKQRGIEVLKSMPEDYKFEDNQYYKDEDSGIYLRIISKGDPSKMASEEDNSEVYFRFFDSSFFASKTDSEPYSNSGKYGEDPLYLSYGNANSYLDYYGSQDYGYYFLSPACAFALEYVGEGGEVSLIVPFTQGSALQKSNYEPIFYERIKYTKIY